MSLKSQRTADLLRGLVLGDRVRWLYRGEVLGGSGTVTGVTRGRYMVRWDGDSGDAGYYTDEDLQLQAKEGA